jgi:hypothetical protein
MNLKTQMQALGFEKPIPDHLIELRDHGARTHPT